MQPKAPRQRRLSLGAAILGCKAPRGYVRSKEESPGPWLDTLRDQHGNSQLFGTIFCSSRAGRDWVLANAPALTIRLSPDSFQCEESWLAHCKAVGRALATRGALKTSIVITCSDDYINRLWLSLLPTHLPKSAAAAAGVKSLTLQGDESQDEPLSSSVAGPFLAACAPRLAGLTGLHLIHCSTPLPSPEALPNLTALSITEAGQYMNPAATSQSVALFLTQLTSLSLLGNPKTTTRWQWSHIFTADHTTTSLTSLTIPYSLQDELLGLLLKHTPSLTHLGVCNMCVKKDEWALLQWGLQRLDCADGRVDIKALRGLPRSKVKEVRVVVGCKGALVLYASDQAQGLEAVEQLADFTFHTPTVSIEKHPSQPGTFFSLATTYTIINQLTHLDAPNTAVTFGHLPIPAYDYHHVHALSVALVELATRKQFWLGFKWGTQVSEPQLRLATKVRAHLLRVQLGEVDLRGEGWGGECGEGGGGRDGGRDGGRGEESATGGGGPGKQATGGSEGQGVDGAHDEGGPSGGRHGGRDGGRSWPAEVIMGTPCDSYTLGVVASLCGCEARPVVRCRTLVLHQAYDTVTFGHLRSFLNRARWAPLTHSQPWTFSLTNTDSSPQALDWQVNLLRRIRFDTPHTECKSVITIHDRAITHALFEILADLPNWGGVLDLSTCTWPHEPCQYERLAMDLSLYFSEWRLSNEGMAVMSVLAGGVDERRGLRGMAPLRLVEVKSHRKKAPVEKAPEATEDEPGLPGF